MVGCGDLADGVERLAALLGVRPAEGGRHPMWGTKNHLVSLGPEIYLELIGPDPEREDPAAPTVFGLGADPAFRVRTWAAKAPHIEADRRRATAAGAEPGRILEGRRRTPGGGELSWRLTDPARVLEGGLVPFLIDWGSSPHPSDAAPRGGRLRALVGEHPAPGRVAAALAALGLELELRQAPEPALVVHIETPDGHLVEIR